MRMKHPCALVKIAIFEEAIFARARVFRVGFPNRPFPSFWNRELCLRGQIAVNIVTRKVGCCMVVTVK